MKCKYLPNLRITAPLLALALVLTLAGCATTYAPTGDNPARINFSLTGTTDKEEINQALSRQWLLPGQASWMPGMRVYGPYWDWGLYIIGEGDSLTPLKPEDDISLYLNRVDSLKINTVLLAPSGTYKLRLLVSVYMMVDMNEGLEGYTTSPVGVKSYKEDLTLTFPANGQLKFTRSFGPKK